VSQRTLVSLLLVAAAACDHGGDDYNEPVPVVVDDTIALMEDQSLHLSELTANDTDVNTLTVVEEPQHGTISTTGDYVPEPGYFGHDRFVYAGRYLSYSSLDEAPRATVEIEIASDGIAYEHSKLVGETSANDMAVGDFDGDGHVDLVTCNGAGNVMTVFRNVSMGEGDYSLEPHVFEGGVQPAGLAVADIDGDGKLDIVIAAKNGVSVYRNLTVGPLAFAGPVVLAQGVNMVDVVATDLDGNGSADIAAIENGSAYPYPTRMHVWANQGNFAFATDLVYTTPSGPSHIVAVDADANGKSDLAVLADDQLSLFVNATTSALAFAARVDRSTGPDPLSLFLADLDGDGHAEIGVQHRYGSLWIYANRGAASPTFEAARAIDLATNTYLVQPAEIDGDGVIDLVGVAGGSAPFSFLANRSTPQMFAFDVAEANISDVGTLKLANFATPTALAFVELDGVAPQEMVVASKASGSGGTLGLRVLFGR
jgi:hypothetical protein